MKIEIRTGLTVNLTLKEFAQSDVERIVRTKCYIALPFKIWRQRSTTFSRKEDGSVDYFCYVKSIPYTAIQFFPDGSVLCYEDDSREVIHVSECEIQVIDGLDLSEYEKPDIYQKGRGMSLFNFI